MSQRRASAAAAVAAAVFGVLHPPWVEWGPLDVCDSKHGAGFLTYQAANTSRPVLYRVQDCIERLDPSSSNR